MTTSEALLETGCEAQSETISTIQSIEQWFTSLSNIQFSGSTSLNFNLQRPDSGPARGGRATLYKGSISHRNRISTHKNLNGKESGTFSIESDEVDFYSGDSYYLAYGPHHSDNVWPVVTSAKIMGNVVMGYKGSWCRYIDHGVYHVTCFYQFDDNPLGIKGYGGSVILREGGEPGRGTILSRKPIFHSGLAKDTVRLDTVSPLRTGTLYNVTTNIYSDLRPVAGFTFTRSN